MRQRLLASLFCSTLVLAACGSTTRSLTPRHPARPRHVATAPRLSDALLLVANREGVVGVHTTNGTVAFRAPYGVAAPDSSTVVQAQPLAAGTRVVATEPGSGRVRWSHDAIGNRRVRVVAPHGTFVALVDGDLVTADSPRSVTTIDVATRATIRRIKLRGSFDPEAFSVDGRYLFALEYMPAMAPRYYSVRRIDLRTLRVDAVPGRSGAPRERMQGYSRTQLMSPDGKQLYTFYVATAPITEHGETYNAFVHVLNLEHGWAFCVDLDERIGRGGNLNPALAITPDGSRLFVSDGASGIVSAIDTTTLRELRVAHGTTVANDALSATSDGTTLFVGAGATIARYDARTLSRRLPDITTSGSLRSLGTDDSAKAIYAATDSDVLVFGGDGRRLWSWQAPGDATTIDPAVYVPGSGAYRCAC